MNHPEPAEFFFDKEFFELEKPLYFGLDSANNITLKNTDLEKSFVNYIQNSGKFVMLQMDSGSFYYLEGTCIVKSKTNGSFFFNFKYRELIVYAPIRYKGVSFM